MLTVVSDYQTPADLEGDLLSDAEDLTSLLFAQCDKIEKALRPDTYTRLGMKTAQDMIDFIGGVLKVGRATIYKRARVARRIAPADRLADLGFEVHVVASGTDDPLHWLSHAAAKNLTAEQLRAAIKEARGETVQPDDLAYIVRSQFGVLLEWDGDRRLVISLDTPPKIDPVVGANCTLTLVQSIGERAAVFAPAEMEDAA